MAQSEKWSNKIGKLYCKTYSKLSRTDMVTVEEGNPIILVGAINEVRLEYVTSHDVYIYIYI